MGVNHTDVIEIIQLTTPKANDMISVCFNYVKIDLDHTKILLYIVTRWDIYSRVRVHHAIPHAVEHINAQLVHRLAMHSSYDKKHAYSVMFYDRCKIIRVFNIENPFTTVHDKSTVVPVHAFILHLYLED